MHISIAVHQYVILKVSACKYYSCASDQCKLFFYSWANIFRLIYSNFFCFSIHKGDIARYIFDYLFNFLCINYISPTNSQVINKTTGPKLIHGHVSSHGNVWDPVSLVHTGNIPHSEMDLAEWRQCHKLYNWIQINGQVMCACIRWWTLSNPYELTDYSVWCDVDL